VTLLPTLALLHCLIGAGAGAWTGEAGTGVEVPIGDARKVLGLSLALHGKVSRAVGASGRWRVVGALRHQAAFDPEPAESFSISGAWIGGEVSPSPSLSVSLTTGLSFRHVSIGSLSETASLAGLSLESSVVLVRWARAELAMSGRYTALHTFDAEWFFHHQIGINVLGRLRF
jgi:hypothetical protein